MSYQKLNLQTGQVLTADALNHIEDGIATASIKCQKVTWAELVQMRNESKLMPGTWYRIIDYVTTTTQRGTSSEGHQFDIIVFALEKNTLCEDAKACLHEEDTYFTGRNEHLDRWTIKYSLDNDSTRFTWADAENGKGVIYRLEDEFGNSFPFDFKNIKLGEFKWPDESTLPLGFAVGFPGQAENSTVVRNIKVMGDHRYIPNIRIAPLPQNTNVIIGNGCDKLFLSQVTMATIGDGCTNIRGALENTQIGNFCYDIAGTFNYVSIGTYCNQIQTNKLILSEIGSNCYDIKCPVPVSLCFIEPVVIALTITTDGDTATTPLQQFRVASGNYQKKTASVPHTLKPLTIGISSSDEIKIFNPADLVQ